MKKTINHLIIVSCFTLGAALAHAEPVGRAEPGRDGPMRAGQMPDAPKHRQMEGRMFKEADTNGDGAISKAEYDAVHARRFKEMDANGDGKITREEMKAAGRKMMEKGWGARFDEADANHDGALTREEAAKMPMLSKNFDKVDADHDGKVTRAEMDAEMGMMRRNQEGSK